MKKKKRIPSAKVEAINPVFSRWDSNWMCQVLMKSIKAVFIFSLLSINYQQHEKLPVEVHRFDSPAVGIGEMGAQMFWRHGSTHFAAKSKQRNVESRSERQGTGTQVTTSSVST